tara:strand:- start:1816 stop:3024 length:1209 start_codon:yes stop_codon:yes gene_type:complete
MRKKSTVYIIIGVLTLALIFFLEYNKKKELNWFPSYVMHHKIPYGTMVFRDVMSEKITNLKEIERPPFEFLKTNEDSTSTYLFVNNNVAFQEAELDELLNWTSKGNTLFIASTSFEKKLLDTLHLKTESLYGATGLEHEFHYKLVNPNLKLKNAYTFEKDYYSIYFSALDTLQTKVIGQVSNSSDSDSTYFTNSIQQPFGKGKIILTAFPVAFTNYFILKNNNKDYTAGLLAYLDNEHSIYADTYYKSGKKFYTSPMYIFLNTKELKWAYYIILIGTFMYVIFEGKRKQRAVPVVVPLKNQTLAFTRTIADMYLERGESKEIAMHKIDYFLDYIRSHFYMNTQNEDSEFYQNLASRSHHSYEEIETLFRQLKNLKNKASITNEELINLNSSIEKFKAKAHGK